VNAVTPGAFDVGSLVVADVKGGCGVDTLFRQIACKQRLALAAAVIAGRVQKIPCQVRMAGAQQAAKTLRAPVGVGDEADAMAGLLHDRILLKHFRICAAQVEFRAEFSFDQIVQRPAIEPEQPERKIGIDLLDVYFRRTALVLRELAGARLSLNAVLNEAFRHIRT
jgi:hypothetical protein